MNNLYPFHSFEKNYYCKIFIVALMCFIFLPMAPLAHASSYIVDNSIFGNSNQLVAANSNYNKLHQSVITTNRGTTYSYGGGSTARDGSIDVYIDPQTGDRVTKVTAPRQDTTQQQNVPINVYPMIDPNSYYPSMPGDNIKPIRPPYPVIKPPPPVPGYQGGISPTAPPGGSTFRPPTLNPIYPGQGAGIIVPPLRLNQ